MAAANLPNTSKTSADANSFSDVVANDQAITAQVNGNLDTTNLSASAAITGTQLVSGAALANLASASVTDAKIASPNNSVYKTVLTATGLITAAVTAGTYYFDQGGVLRASASSVAAVGLRTVYIDDADFTVGSLTQKVRVRAQLYTNATAPTATFTMGLYPISSVAGAGLQNTVTLGTVVAGTTVAYAAPAASTAFPTSSATGFSTDVTVPADGHYCLGVATSVATTAASSSTLIAMQLQTKNV